MRFSRYGFVAVFLATTLALGALPHGDATANWSNNISDAVPVSTTFANVGRPAIASDGAGGAYITWSENRFGTSDIFVLRLNADGNAPAGWNTDGNVICSAAGEQTFPIIVANGSGGAIVAWEDERVALTRRPYVQRVNANGSTSWLANGVQAGPGDLISTTMRIATDMAGGAYLALSVFGGAYAQRVTSAGALAAGYGGVAALPLGFNSNYGMRLVSDGVAGGVWVGDSGGGLELTALRLDASGNPAPGWAFGGNAMFGFQLSGYDTWDATADASGGIWGARIDGGGWPSARRMNGSGITLPGGVGAQGYANRVRAVGDGIGGVILAFSNQSPGNEGIYLVRGTAGGGKTPEWLGTFGVFSRLYGPEDWDAISDGAGGILIVASTRFEPFYSEDDLIAQHVGIDASLIAGWGSIGSPLIMAEYIQDQPVMAPDGIGGAIVAWRDERPGTFLTDVYANRLDRFGEVGIPEPRLVEARDVPSDQGGQVRLRWTKSYVDSTPLNRVDAYWVWREVPPATAAAASLRGARVLDSPTMTMEQLSALRESGSLAPGRLFRRMAGTASVAATYWEFLAELGANGSPTYSYVAATAADSIGAAPARTKWRVEALDYLQGGWEGQQSLVRFWMSNVDSASSKDNLAPITPQPFLGNANSGDTYLHWDPNPEVDLAGYRLHRGTTALFTPDNFNLISSQPDTGFVDGGQVGFYYKLAAVDIHDNVSGYALLTPSGTVGAPDPSVGIELAMMPVRPNPSAGASVIEFALPRAGRVDLNVYDASGRLIRGLVSGMMTPGVHQQTWDGRDRSGREVGPGLYLIRLVTLDGTRSQRVAVIP